MTIDTEARAVAASDKTVRLSGNTYVSAMRREDIGQYPPRAFMVRLPYVDDARDCQHGVTICARWECVESWSVDYRIRLQRTGAGRQIIDKLRLDPTREIGDRRGIEVLRHEDYINPTEENR